MANRQPGHHTFGLRTAEQIVGILSMTESIQGEQYQSVYNTTYKVRQIAPYNGAGTSDVTVFISPNQVILDGSGDYFYTGTVVAPYNAGTGTSPAIRLAKGTADTERIIGVVVGGTGPTIANTSRYTGTIQYSGKAPVLLQIGQSTSARGKFLTISTGVSGTSTTDVTAAIGSYGVCTANAYASGMTSGFGPGLTGLTGNYAMSFIRPVETQ